MKVLCVCMAGNNRSGALSYLLKDPKRGGHDAVNVGHATAGVDLMSFLMSWADRIVLLEKHMCKYVPDHWQYKTLVFDVGPDIWSTPRHPDLLKKLEAMLEAGRLK